MTDYPRPARGRKESVDSLFLIGWTPRAIQSLLSNQ